MDVIVRISKEKKIEDFRMVIIPSGRSEIGLIRAKNYGIIVYPNKKDFEKIGEMIYWGFNESDDKVIEHLSNIKIEKRFYNCSSYRKVTNEYNEVWLEFFKGIYSISFLLFSQNLFYLDKLLFHNLLFELCLFYLFQKVLQPF